jgi:predicted MPP superfamily phosphohydrolase
MAGLSTLGAAALGAGGVGYAYEVEPGWSEISSVRLELPRLSAEFDGYRIVQVSDIHADEWMTPERLSEIVRLVNGQRPDLVVITGDFVTSEDFTEVSATDVAPGLVEPLSRLKPRDSTVAVLGNHDHWTDSELVRRVIRESGIVDLSNAVHPVERKDVELHVAGVDDVMENQDRLDLVLDRLPSTGAAILLAHEPDFADTSAATRRFDLQLSGHSHGGQIRLPLLGAPVLPPLAREYPEGLYEVVEMIQYTNRGLGMIEPRVRFNCRPEITVFTLGSAQTSQT